MITAQERQEMTARRVDSRPPGRIVGGKVDLNTGEHYLYIRRRTNGSFWLQIVRRPLEVLARLWRLRPVDEADIVNDGQGWAMFGYKEEK